ncbi:beta-glucosidase BglX [Dysgonomonas sp. BGC7]|uniref:beta-glucosidase BglX n=2 Tax=Dysgonomonas sp. BGC7 TaxID=1658008 RepID=UPI0006836F61|nr:beta-glucosidase BglX [Dysgonomonas sp. BGC7]
MRKLGLKTLCLFVFCAMFGYLSAQHNTENRIEEILSRMTLRQKIGQMNQVNARKPDEKLYKQIRNGEVGSILNAEDPVLLNQLQKIAVEESSLGIPVVFARDVIHGFKTIFPIPLGQAASFNPEIVETGARIAAVEASENGVRWTFAPMMDISRDPRWGRIAESFGEDTYLSEEMAIAMVRGFQGEDLSQPSSIAACAKHFIGYGAVEGGRDYNISNIPERQLRNIYLPPFERSIKETGCATIMTSFNANDGVPPSASKFLLTDLLRDEWKFDGVVVSDWASVSIMVTQGFCDDRKNAALKAANAGMEMEMVSGCYTDYLEQLVKEGKVSEKTIDNAVRNILRLKYRLGLFEKPYTDLTSERKVYSEAHLRAAKQAAEESFVLLKNQNNILPLGNKVKNVAIIGPLADAPHDQMGTWCFDGEKEHTQTPLNALKKQFGENVNFIYEQTLAFSRDRDKSRFAQAIEAAKQSDVVLLFVGEESILSGEAHSLADLDLVGVQSELLEELSKAGKPIITIVMAGRPLTIAKEMAQSSAVLYAWHPGTMGGPAIADVLFGKSYPSGKLPVTFPRYVGQIPLYYNYERIGRPAKKNEVLLNDIPLEAKQSSLGNTSYYLDAGFDALFDFGYGLSYTTFEYSDLVLSKYTLTKDETLQVSVILKNTGSHEGCEVVQLYTADVAASASPLVKELKGFKRIILKPGEQKKVIFELPIEKLAFWNTQMEKVVEPGKFEIMIGGNSVDLLKSSFVVN